MRSLLLIALLLTGCSSSLDISQYTQCSDDSECIPIELKCEHACPTYVSAEFEEEAREFLNPHKKNCDECNCVFLGCIDNHCTTQCD